MAKKTTEERQQTGSGNEARIVASNAIVRLFDISCFQNAMSRPVLVDAGEGPVDAFIDGRHIRGSWRRPDLDSQTEYRNENGDPLILLPGKTFVRVVPPTLDFVFADAGGAVRPVRRHGATVKNARKKATDPP